MEETARWGVGFLLCKSQKIEETKKPQGPFTREADQHEEGHRNASFVRVACVAAERAKVTHSDEHNKMGSWMLANDITISAPLCCSLHRPFPHHRRNTALQYISRSPGIPAPQPRLHPSTSTLRCARVTRTRIFCKGKMQETI